MALRAQATAGDREQAVAVARLIRLREQVATADALSERMQTKLETKLYNRLARVRIEIAKDLRKRQ